MSLIELNKNEIVKTPISIDQFERVCEIIEASNKSVETACREIGISSRSFRIYMKIVGDQAELRYARAKDDQLRVIAEEILDIADAEVEQNDSAAVNRNRLRIDSRKWLLSKLKPKVYGDNITIDQNVRQLPGAVEIQFVDVTNAVNVSNNDKDE